MKTNADYALLAKTISEQYGADAIPRAIVLLRSIELDAWREVRELVLNIGTSWDQDISRNEALSQMDRVIQQLQLK